MAGLYYNGHVSTNTNVSNECLSMVLANWDHIVFSLPSCKYFCTTSKYISGFNHLTEIENKRIPVVMS